MNRIAGTALTLGAVAAVCAAIVAGTYRLTATRIEANRIAWIEASLLPALGDVTWDSGLMDSMLTLDPPHGLPGDEATQVYRVYEDGRGKAALFTVTANEGYAGPIRLLVGVDVDGRVTGVRVVEHSETPGLGDKIESSRSDWVLQFEGSTLASPPLDAWRIRADGGDFDQITGATVTTRAVVGAVRDTLLYFDVERARLFERPPATDEDSTE